jgi:hypothetical protein
MKTWLANSHLIVYMNEKAGISIENIDEFFGGWKH